MTDELLAEADRIRTRSGRTAEVVGLLADRLRALDGRPTEPTEADQLRRLVKLHMGAHQFSTEAFLHMGEGVLRKVADGGSLDDVLEIVGDCMNERDAVDEDCEALFDRAKTALVGDRPAAPTREQVEEAIREVMRERGALFAGTLISDRLAYTQALTDRVLTLFGRTVAAPPRTCPGCGAAPEVWVTASLHHPDASGRYGCNPNGREVSADG